MAYNLRTQATKKGHLYSSIAQEVLKKDEKNVKIHYVGYSAMHDEWRDVEDIVPPSDEPVKEALQMQLYHHFKLHR